MVLFRFIPRQWSLDSEDSDDDVLPVGALIPLDRLAVCCAQLDDFGWEVPDCVPGMLLSEQDSDVECTELTQDVLPDVFPVVSAVVAAVPWPLPAIDVPVPQAIFKREAAPLVVPLIEEMYLRVMSGRDIEVGLTELSQDALPDVFPVVSAEVAAVSWPLPAVDVSVPQAIFEREATPLVVSLNEAMSVHVMSGRGMKVGLTGLTQDIQVLPDVFQVMIDETAAVPMPLDVVVETEPQDDIRRETALSVVPLDDEMTSWVATVGLGDNGSGCPVESILILTVVLWIMGWLLQRCFRPFLRVALLCRRPCRPCLTCFPLLF